jgi:hypothetical protein
MFLHVGECNEVFTVYMSHSFSLFGNMQRTSKLQFREVQSTKMLLPLFRNAVCFKC